MGSLGAPRGPACSHPPRFGTRPMLVAEPQERSSACRLAVPAALRGAGGKDAPNQMRFLYPLEGFSWTVGLTPPGSIYHKSC